MVIRFYALLCYWHESGILNRLGRGGHDTGEAEACTRETLLFNCLPYRRAFALIFVGTGHLSMKTLLTLICLFAVAVVSASAEDYYPAHSSVIGKVEQYTVKKGESLIELARKLTSATTR